MPLAGIRSQPHNMVAKVGCLPDRPVRRIPGERHRPVWAQALGHPVVHHRGGEDASPGADPLSARTGEEDASPASHSHPTVHHYGGEDASPGAEHPSARTEEGDVSPEAGGIMSTPRDESIASPGAEPPTGHPYGGEGRESKNASGDISAPQNKSPGAEPPTVHL